MAYENTCRAVFNFSNVLGAFIRSHRLTMTQRKESKLSTENSKRADEGSPFWVRTMIWPGDKPPFPNKLVSLT